MGKYLEGCIIPCSKGIYLTWLSASSILLWDLWKWMGSSEILLQYVWLVSGLLLKSPFFCRKAQLYDSDLKADVFSRPYFSPSSLRNHVCIISFTTPQLMTDIWGKVAKYCRVHDNGINASECWGRRLLSFKSDYSILHIFQFPMDDRLEQG